MQRTEYKAVVRDMSARRGSARVLARPAAHVDSMRIARLVMAGLLAFGVTIWVTTARAQQAPAAGAASGDSSSPKTGATPVAGPDKTPNALSPTPNQAPGPVEGATPAPAPVAPAGPGAPPAASSAGPAKKVTPTDKEEGTDEDAATSLPEPEDGKPPRGASGPPPAPRGPSAFVGLPTVLPSPAEAGHIDEVALPKRTVAVLSGRSTWDDGFKSLFDSFEVLAAELAKAGVKPVGRPIAVFLSTDEGGFSYDAMAPLAAAPADAAQIGGGVRIDQAPAGKAIRFTHKAPYEEIDTTYEAITAYLDSKKISAEDAFIEEYVTDPKDPSDATLQINIYVQPKIAGKPSEKSVSKPNAGPADNTETGPGTGKSPE